MSASRKWRVNRGNWSVQRERFRLPSSRNPPVPFTPRRMDEVMSAVMKTFGLENQYWHQALLDEWESLVGSEIARHARPGRLQRKTLYVFVEHPIWLQQLYALRGQMLHRIQERFGREKITALRLQIAPEPGGYRQA